MVRVTFLIVIYKENSSLIHRCLSSIKSQSIKEFKVLIFLNDKSRNDLESFLHELNDPRFILIVNGSNIGLTKALNLGVPLIDTEFIARLDPDDYCHQDRLKYQLAFMDAHPNYVLCGSKYHETAGSNYVDVKVPFLENHDDLINALKSFNPFAHSTLFFRSSVFKSLKGYDEKYRYSQDYDLIWRFIEYGKIYNLPVFLINRESRAEQISIKRRKQQLYFSIKIRLKYNYRYGFSLASSAAILKSFINILVPQFLYEKIRKT